MPSDSHDSAAQLFLEYIPSSSSSSSQPISLEEMADGGSRLSSSITPKAMHRLSSRLESRLELETSTQKVEKWNVEQIQDFVRKLGFIGSEKEGGDKIKHYRHISDVCCLGNSYKPLYACPPLLCLVLPPSTLLLSLSFSLPLSPISLSSWLTNFSSFILNSKILETLCT